MQNLSAFVFLFAFSLAPFSFANNLTESSKCAESTKKFLIEDQDIRFNEIQFTEGHQILLKSREPDEEFPMIDCQESPKEEDSNAKWNVAVKKSRASSNPKGTSGFMDIIDRLNDAAGAGNVTITNKNEFPVHTTIKSRNMLGSSRNLEIYDSISKKSFEVLCDPPGVQIKTKDANGKEVKLFNMPMDESEDEVACAATTYSVNLSKASIRKADAAEVSAKPVSTAAPTGGFAPVKSNSEGSR